MHKTILNPKNVTPNITLRTQKTIIAINNFKVTTTRTTTPLILLEKETMGQIMGLIVLLLLMVSSEVLATLMEVMTI